MFRFINILMAVVLAGSLPAWVRGGEWPQWMGPSRDGNWTESGILTEFPKEGPKKLWSKPIHGGYSGPAVAQGRVFVMDYTRKTGSVVNDPAKRCKLSGEERVICLDANTGKELWQHHYPCDYEISYAVGPRCTPTVDGGRVYSLGAMGDLCCLDTATGRVIWSRNFKKDYQAATPVWGFCGHPLVYKDLLICMVGGENSVAVAFDKTTGKEVWKSLSAPDLGYCPPTVIEAGGTTQLLAWHATALNSLDPLTGKKYWSVELKPSYGMAIAAPQKSDSYLYAGGIGWQSVMLKLDADKPAVTELWRGKKDTALYPATATPLMHKGVMYGCDCISGKFKAIDLATGKRLWETMEPTAGAGLERVAHGTAFAVKNGDHFYLFSERGELIVARLSPEKYEEVSRAKLIAPTGEAFGRKVVWSHPAFANRCIYLRNDEEIVCYSLAQE